MYYVAFSHMHHPCAGVVYFPGHLFPPFFSLSLFYARHFIQAIYVKLEQVSNEHRVPEEIHPLSQQ
jgi:hypothetical protein